MEYSIKGFKFKVAILERRLSQESYAVTKTEGEWPSDEALITICDNLNYVARNNEMDPSPSSFGGSVWSQNSNEKVVTVFVD